MVVVVLIGWRGIATQAMAGIRVDVGMPHCGERDLRAVQWQRIRLPAVALESGMRCRVTFRMHNPGNADVTVTAFRHQISGPDGGAAFRVVGINGEVPDDSSGIEARWHGAIELPAGESASLWFRVVYRPAGCTAAGSVLRAGSFVTVRAWGRDREIALPTALLFRGTAESDCPTEG